MSGILSGAVDQPAALKGYIAAIKGEKGDSFTYEDFTPEQLEKLAEEAAKIVEAGISVIVCLDEGDQATHTAPEIYNAILEKKAVVYHHTDRTTNEFISLKEASPSKAVFSKTGYPTEFDIFDIEIDNSGTISYNTHFSSALVNQAVEKVETDLAPVSYLPQALTPEQQAQARKNIDAADVKCEEALFYQTDNLLDFQTAGFWVNEDFDGKSVSYTMSTAEKIPVKGGSELYTAMKGLSTDVLGTAFLIRVREYNNADEVVVAQTTYSTINSTGATHYTLNESTTKIAILLTTNNWEIGITPELFIEMDPLIYAGFNSSITRDTVYRKQGSNMERLDEELDGLKAIIGEPLAGMIPSSLGTPYPDIDTNAKTFTLYQDTVLLDRRLVNGWYATASTIVYDYSALTTSAIHFCWDIVNATVKAFAYNAILDNAKYIPICMLRTNRNAVSSAIPIRVNGLWFGTIGEDKINQGSVWKNDNVKGINHRGDTKTAPENTLPAFKVSKENGFFGVETDVRFTSDGVAVLLHDDTINRTARNADGSELATAINISDITYEEALTYDFGVWKSSAYAGTPITTFEQFLKICRKLGLHPYIELKVGTQEQIEGLADAVIRNGMKGKVTWISYNAGMLEIIKAHTSSARLGFLVNAWDAGVIETLTALKNEDNEVFLDLCDPATDDIVNSLIAADIPLEVYSNGDYSIAVADPYITGVTTDSSNPSESMYKYLMNGI